MMANKTLLRLIPLLFTCLKATFCATINHPHCFLQCVYCDGSCTTNLFIKAGCLVGYNHKTVSDGVAWNEQKASNTHVLLEELQTWKKSPPNHRIRRRYRWIYSQAKRRNPAMDSWWAARPFSELLVSFWFCGLHKLDLVRANFKNKFILLQICAVKNLTLDAIEGAAWRSTKCTFHFRYARSSQTFTSLWRRTSRIRTPLRTS